MLVNKWKVCMILGTAVFMATTASVFAESTVAVKGGILAVSSDTDCTALDNAAGNSTTVLSKGFTFPDRTVDISTVIPAATATEFVRVDDNTGKNKGGWQVNVSATDLTATVADLTTADANDTVTVTIPIGSVIQVAGSDLARLKGPTLNTADFTVGSGPLTGTLPLLTAAKAKGQGAYKLMETYIMNLPSYLPAGSTVTPSSPTDSSFTNANVTDLSLFAGTYSTTIEYSTSEGP